MEININGKIYIYFVRSIFNGNIKTGLEFIINVNKSDNNIIDGLKRLNLLNNNKFIVLLNNYPKEFNIINVKYLADIHLSIIDKNIIIKSLNILKIEKEITPILKLNKSLYINKYATKKNRTLNEIMDILKTST
jgi:hypothetical protein